MKIFLFLSFLFATVGENLRRTYKSKNDILSIYTYSIEEDDYSIEEKEWKQFNYFQMKFTKEYNTLHELENRFKIFRTNLHNIIQHNSNATNTFKLGMNQFTDLTPEEFKNMYLGGYAQTKPICKPFTFSSAYLHLSNSIDWREKKVVSNIRDQGQCGSCWAFATTSNAESVWAISTGKLLDLSEQFLVDCSTGIPYLNMGCNGGNPDSALKYMIQNGQRLEADYPYTAKDGKCKNGTSSDVKFTECYDVPSKNQIALKAATTKQPVVVAIEADTRYFQSYSSGILDSINCGTNLDHAVEIVGYGIEITNTSNTGKKYWIVRNSWGETWGENGYIRILRSDSTNDIGICGISAEPSFLTI